MIETDTRSVGPFSRCTRLVKGSHVYMQSADICRVWIEIVALRWNGLLVPVYVWGSTIGSKHEMSMVPNKVRAVCRCIVNMRLFFFFLRVPLASFIVVYGHV